jgi:hypothetical protein
MIRRRPRQRQISGYHRFEDAERRTLSGHADGDFVRLRDQQGNEWVGIAEASPDGLVRYRLRDPHGKFAVGISDGYGISLRDDYGRTWRGFID